MLLLGTSAALGQGYLLADGGGLDAGSPYGREVFAWMVEKSKDAEGRPGGVVILGAVPLEKDERIAAFEKAGAAWVRAYVVDRANADTDEIGAAIRQARVVFIRGGDQGRYVGWWRGTQTDRAIHEVFAKGGVVAGTSAGCAVLGQVTYDALKDSLHPLEVLADARHEDLSLTYDFLGLAPGVLFDTHFTERGRLPRLAVMLAAAKADKGVDVVGLGVDAGAGLCIGPDGIGEVKGDGVVTMLVLTRSTRAVVEKGTPPLVTQVRMALLPPGTKVNTKTREIIGGEAWRTPLAKGAWAGPAAGVTLDGGAASWEPPAGLVGVPTAWTGGRIAPRMNAALARLVSEPPAVLCLFADEGADAAIGAKEITAAGSGRAPRSLVLIEATDITRGGQAGEFCGLELALLHILPPGERWPIAGPGGPSPGR